MFRKIGFKLIFIVGVTAIVIIGGYTYLNLKSETNILLSEVERHALELSDAIKNSTRHGMMLNQREMIHDIINTIGKDPAIYALRVFNKDGEIIYSNRHEDIGKMLDKYAESCYACHAANKPLEKLAINDRTRIYRSEQDSSRILGVINPIYNEKSCYEADCHAHPSSAKVLGVLDVSIHLKEIDEKIHNNEIQGLIFALIAVSAIGFIIALFIKRWVDKPVKELVNATNQVGLGNLNYFIKETTKDELGTLAQSFNNMIKKLKEMQMQVFQSEKMASLGQLAAGVAHEINNPLTGVLTYSSYLLKRTQNNPELQEDLKVIVRETMRSREIVRGLLDFARQSTPKKTKININEIIDRALSVVNNQLRLNNVIIEKNYDDKLPSITADANQMQQVFINLLVNANDSISKDGGKIFIKTSVATLSQGIANVKSAVCEKNHNLIENDYKIEGFPSIKLKVRNAKNEGIIHLDAVYGRHKDDIQIKIEKEKPYNLLCPVCETTLIAKNEKCPKCGGPVYKIKIPNNGYIKGCAQFNDDWQKWDIPLESEKNFIEITVKDTGCGIPKENLNKIFDPFFTTKGQKGTGLGLSVIWGIIEIHNGTINVESEVGKGTTFTIRLPL
ncbi:sensor histidine kinase [Melioribacteraceae bacterium 4301-Me]|uniref:sensor histidine kinase n=1 Tax=Pyranulibacter aquaticus TaxID=3163344 RepID=UPI00359AE5CA